MDIAEILDVLLPYQRRWNQDKSQVKVCEKSRRIGLTWAQAADDVLLAATEGRDGMDVLYISFNQDMTREYIETCASWAKKIGKVAGEVGELVLKDDDEREIKAFRIDFASGHKILALTYAATPDIRVIDTEVHVASGGDNGTATQRVTVAHPPIARVSGKQTDPAKKYQAAIINKTYPTMLGDCRDQRSFTLWATFWLSECWRIARPGAPALVFTDWRQLPCVVDAVQVAGFGYRGIVVWHKRNARPLLGEFRRDSEFVVYGSKAPFIRASRKCLPGVYNILVDRDKVHLTSKPFALLEALMEIVPEGGTVLDPFLGGGTTALAAKNTGRRCVGVELSEEYARIAAERVKAA